jgi:cytochrome b
MKNSKAKVRVWDGSIRVFHWLFALAVGGSLAVAFLVDHDSDFFRYHMLLGLSAGFLLFLRGVLFLVGTGPIRLGAALNALLDLPRYIGTLFSRSGTPYRGHNPLAWLVYLLMFAAVLGMILTGIFMVNHTIEEIHEVLGWVILGLVGAHVLGILIHTLRFRENVAASMITGRKEAPTEDAIGGSRPVFGVVVLVLSLAFTIQLFRNYECGAAVVRLPWIGVTVNLGEAEACEYYYDDAGHEHREGESHEHMDSH